MIDESLRRNRYSKIGEKELTTSKVKNESNAFNTSVIEPIRALNYRFSIVGVLTS